MHDPSVSQSLPRLGCLWGTLSPSRRQMRSTRLSLIVQPRLTKQPGYLAIAVAAVLPSQLDDISREPFLILTTTRDFALRRAVLSERRTGAALGHMQLRSDLLNAGTATRGA